MGPRSLLRQPRQRRLERIEPVTQHWVELRARIGQRHLAHLAIEQRKARLRLQCADLVANGGRRNSQLLGGSLEAAQTRDGFERAECGQRKRSTSHAWHRQTDEMVSCYS